jgi:hypothetical protein
MDVAFSALADFGGAQMSDDQAMKHPVGMGIGRTLRSLRKAQAAVGATPAGDLVAGLILMQTTTALALAHGLLWLAEAQAVDGAPMPGQGVTNPIQPMKLGRPPTLDGGGMASNR